MATREQIICAYCREYERRYFMRRWLRNLIAIVIVATCAATMGVWLAS